MEWFNKDQEPKDSSSTETNGGIFLNKRQVNRVVALSLSLCIFVFIGGYFWGQKVATDQLINAVEKDSFADQIYYSMCSIYDLKDDESNEPEVASGEEDVERNEQLAENNASSVSTEVVKAPTTATAVSAKKYFAQLVGFGSLKTAEQLVGKLAKDNITVSVHTRHSKTPKGRLINWYQVVTPEFGDKGELEKLVTQIKTKEKLHDIRIVEIGLA
jgi:hypothetical protein